MRENDLPIAISTGQYKEFYLGVTNPAKANCPQFSHSFQTLTGLSLEDAPTAGAHPPVWCAIFATVWAKGFIPEIGPYQGLHHSPDSSDSRLPSAAYRAFGPPSCDRFGGTAASPSLASAPLARTPRRRVVLIQTISGEHALPSFPRPARVGADGNSSAVSPSSRGDPQRVALSIQCWC